MTSTPRRPTDSIDVLAAQGGETFYRLLRSEQAQLHDFNSARELGRRVPRRTAWVIAVGVSMFDSVEGALDVARRRPAFVARVVLPAGRGVTYAKTAGPGHHTIWAAPEDLLAATVEVVRHP
ncbi:MAG: hypothetical protein ACYC0H_01350 [Solirubrobacteraceae bacterium]